MRVLVATTIVPDPSRGGGEVVTTAFVAALRATGAEVDVVGLLRPHDPVPIAADGVRFVVAGRRPIETAGAGRRAQLAWTAEAAARREPFSVAKYRAAGYRRALAELEPWDLAIIDHLQMAWLADEAGSPFVLLDHNHEAAIYAQQAAESGPAGRLVWRREERLVDALERRTAAAAEEVWALTAGDAEALAGSARRVRVFAVPGARQAASVAPKPSGPHIALLGTWTWGPNLAGLRWFIDEVVPLLGADGPEVLVAGRGAQVLEPVPARVRLVGRVPDAHAFLATAAAVAVPALGGSGVQVKTLDAIASGAPVVATQVALRGIDDPPAAVRVAEGPEAFAAALLEATAARRSDDGVAWAAARAERFAHDVRTALADLGGPR